MRPKSLLLIAAPRTGSNYFLNLLAYRPDACVYHEVFHPQQAYGIEGPALAALSRRLGRRFSGANDPSLVKAVAANPRATVASLVEGAGEAALVVFKLFPGHGDGTLATVRQALREVDHAAFIKRRIVDSYISVVKAESAQSFFGHDTTALKPALDIEHFLHWYDYTSQWYIDCTVEWMRRFNSSDVPVLRYESFAAGDNDTNFGTLARLLDERVGLSLPPHDVAVKDVLSRQDRGGAVQDKVANYAEFERAVTARGLGHVLHRHF